MKRVTSNRISLALLVVLALSMASCGGAHVGAGIPPQAPAALSGPEVDTSELAESETPQRATLHVLVTNDMHGQVYPKKGRWIDADNPPMVGGFNALAGAIAKARGRYGVEHVLLVDVGDIYAGTPEGNLTRGQLVVDFMNALGYEAVALGNHEFDQGLQTLVDLSKALGAPFLAANVVPKVGKEGELAGRAVTPTRIIERGGFKVGLVGVISPDTPMFTIPDAARAFEFGDPVLAITDAVGTLKAEGADFVIVLSHMGLDKDKEIADAMPKEVVAILGGHSHTLLQQPYRSDATGVLVTQTKGKTSGIYDVSVDVTEAGPRAEGELITVLAEDYPEAPEVSAIVAKYAPQIDKIMAEKLGSCPRGLTPSAEGSSSLLGNFIADVMRQATKADLAVTNKGGIRSNLEPGDVTMRNLYEVAPFGNTLVVIKMTGKALIELMTNAAKGPALGLEISGGQARYATGKMHPRLASFKIGGSEVSPDKTYTVVTNSFLAGGGDGHTAFKAGESHDTGTILRDALADFFRKHGTCTRDGAARISLP